MRTFISDTKYIEFYKHLQIYRLEFLTFSDGI